MGWIRPRVSVGLPVYNGERFLENALTRLVEQDFEDFELIICDNASTDGTDEICRGFAARDRRIRYYRNATNIGLAANHNRTFELSRGPLFKWVSHDDDYPRVMLKRLVRALEESPPNVGVVYSWCEYIDESGEVEGMDSDGVDLDDPWPHRRLAHLLQHVHMYNSPFGLMRADVLRRTRLHGLYPKADHVLLAELAMLGTFMELREPLLRIRRHSGRTFTANRTSRALREIFTPGRRRRWLPVSMRSKMMAELVWSAMLVAPTLRDKILCTAVALSVPQWRTFRAFGGRQKQQLRRIMLTIANRGAREARR
jgi:glycosyltransferase involved in cell wall biosynthesis